MRNFFARTKQWVAAGALSISLVSVSSADSPCGVGPDLTCDSISGCDSPGSGLYSDPTWQFSGWLNGGLMLSSRANPSGFNGAYNQIDNDGGMFNQAYLILDKAVEKSNQTIVGGRFDALFGHDFYLAQSKGLELNPNGSLGWNNEDYGLALPQAYGSVGNSDAFVRAGHFYTPIGYEGVPATSNFFYSKSNSYMFAGPFTHWGAIGTTRLGDSVTVDSGLVNGWNALDRTSDKVAFVNRISFGEKASPTKLSFGLITGDEENSTSNYTNRTRYSAILSQQLGARTEYVFHHWLGNQSNNFENGNSAEWYGIDQYLFYTLSSKLRAGTRMEWFRDDDGVRIGLNRPSNPNKPPYVGNLYSLSSGLNYSPVSSMMIRPEVRYDWFDGTGNPFNDNVSSSQIVAGLDVILTF